MGGTKIKGRGPDKKKRKPRARKATTVEVPEKPEKNILRDIISVVSEKIKRKKKDEEPWELDFGPPVKSMMLGRHVFKREKPVEINLKEL